MPPAPLRSPHATGTRAVIEAYLADIVSIVEQVDTGAVEHVVQRLQAARDLGQTVFVAGNGGSAATATHWANDLGKATKRSGRRPIRVMSLCDNASWMTALANDEGFERVFSGQLENFAGPGDVLALISASGSSPNLIDAVRLAQSRDMTTIALLGFDGGALKDMVDHVIWVETEIGSYGLVETAHSMLADIVTCCLIQDRADSAVPGPAPS
jgi:D-sedoheptulose 7-phosphate isomerase